MEPQNSLPHLQGPTTGSYPEPEDQSKSEVLWNVS